MNPRNEKTIAIIWCIGLVLGVLFILYKLLEYIAQK